MARDMTQPTTPPTVLQFGPKSHHGSVRDQSLNRDKFVTMKDLTSGGLK